MASGRIPPHDTSDVTRAAMAPGWLAAARCNLSARGTWCLAWLPRYRWYGQPRNFDVFSSVCSSFVIFVSCHAAVRPRIPTSRCSLLSRGAAPGKVARAGGGGATAQLCASRLT